MPVIGRLDEQVHDVLISPVSKRRRGDEQPAPRQERQDDPAPDDSHQQPSQDENRRGRDELPVWLL